MPELILTVGLPRSGKSTWARHQVAPVVNPDAIRLAVHGRPFYAPAEPLVWATARLMVRALFLAGHPRVVLDATNITRKRRDKWRDPEWRLQFVEFETSAEECSRRARAGGRDDLVPVIERMASTLEWVAEEERSHA